jgi:SEC-C motif-containing protein
LTVTKAVAKSGACPCGGARYADCCGAFIEGRTVPRKAAELMRSRYTAYVLEDEAYLRATWHPSTRPQGRIVQDGAKWLGLEVRKAAEEGSRATVEFVARCRVDGRAQRIHEISRFVRELGHWLYIDGSFSEPSKNDMKTP